MEKALSFSQKRQIKDPKIHTRSWREYPYNVQLSHQGKERGGEGIHPKKENKGEASLRRNICPIFYDDKSRDLP